MGGPGRVRGVPEVGWKTCWEDNAERRPQGGSWGSFRPFSGGSGRSLPLQVPDRWVPAPGLAALRPRGALPARPARLHRRPRVPGQLRPARQRRAPVRGLGGLRLLPGAGVGRQGCPGPWVSRPAGIWLRQGSVGSCAFGTPCHQEPWRYFLCQTRSWQPPLGCSGTGPEHIDQPGVLLRSSVGTCCPHHSPGPTTVPDVSFPCGPSVVCPAARIPRSLRVGYVRLGGWDLRKILVPLAGSLSV